MTSLRIFDNSDVQIIGITNVDEIKFIILIV